MKYITVVDRKHIIGISLQSHTFRYIDAHSKRGDVHVNILLLEGKGENKPYHCN